MHRFKKIYIHETGYGGLDLCLSDSKEYALSFLIKNSLICFPKEDRSGYYEVFLTQTQLFDFIEKNCGIKKLKDEDGKVYYELTQKEHLIERKETLESAYNKIVFLRRKGLESRENIKNKKFKDEEHFKSPLAAFSIEDINKYPLTFEGGKGAAVIAYIDEYKNQFANNEEKIKFAREYAGYCPETIKNGKV